MRLLKRLVTCNQGAGEDLAWGDCSLTPLFVPALQLVYSKAGESQVILTVEVLEERVTQRSQHETD